MRLSIIIMLLLSTAAAVAGPYTLGPGSDQIADIFASQAVTSSGTTSTAFYAVGMDQETAIDLWIEGAGASSQVTITGLFQVPGGNAIGYPVETTPTEQLVWDQATMPAGLVWPVTAPYGAERLYLHATTDDTDGVTVTASAIGR